MKTKNNLPILKACSLFEGLQEPEIEAALDCLKPTQKAFKKGSNLFHSGDSMTNMGIVLSGSVNITKEDFNGNETLLAKIMPSDMFGEAFACSGTMLTVTVSVPVDSRILFINSGQILSNHSQSCIWHSVLIGNLMKTFSQKNLFLTERIEHLSKRTLKDKIMSYLLQCAIKNNSNTFTIPHDRQGMADYLATDRSALSAVLSNLKREGIIDFHKNMFTIL